jgi:hypothetical protein
MNAFNRLLLAGTLIVGSASLLSLTPVLAQVRQERPDWLAQVQAPPAPTPPVENLQPPVATVSIPNGRLNITLVNQTGTQVVYQVLGERNQGTLQTDASATFNQREVPFNLSFYRPDRGPIEVVAEAAKPGELRVIFKRGSSFDTDKISLTVQKSGEIFLN